MKNLIFICLLVSSTSYARFNDYDVQELVRQSELKDSDALMIWQNGVLKHSFNKNPDQLYSIQSITKSIVAMTAQCLLKKPAELDQQNLFKEWAGTPKANITLRELLQMSSGIQDGMDYWKRDEFSDFSLTLPLVTTPGYNFSYANASTMLVARWMKEKTGQTFSQNAKKCFFDPMGIKDWTINKDKAGNEFASGGLYMKAEDLLKFGIMLIQNGQYAGKTYLTQNQVWDLRSDYLSDGNGYGLGFWTWGRNIYYMEGFLGQFVFVVPRENLVVLRIRNVPNMQWSEENDLNWFHELPWALEALL
jgi:CubicO group peptidase (beta-lactamase class C family)